MSDTRTSSSPTGSSSSGRSVGTVTPTRPRSGLLVLVGIVSILVAIGSLAVNAWVGYQAMGLLSPSNSPAAEEAARADAAVPRAPVEVIQASQLPADQVEAILKAARDRGANPKQIDALKGAVGTPDQRLIRPSATAEQATSQLRVMNTTPNGMFMVVTPGGPIVTDSEGNIMGRSAPSTMPGAKDAASAPEAVRTARFLLLDAGISLVLSGLLLIVGVAGLACSSRAAGMHRAYALLKIAAAVAVSAIWIRGDYPPFVAAGAGGDLLGQWSANLALVLLVACLYPLLLLLVFGAFGRRPSGTAAGA